VTIATTQGNHQVLSKRPLTDRGIAALKPASAVAYRLAWDAIVPSLAVRVTATGQKSFVLVTRYPSSSNPTARSLGKVGAITIEDARVKAREWLKLIVAGTDPAQAGQAAETNTLRAICSEYLVRNGSKRTLEWEGAILRRLVLPHLGVKPINEVRRSDIVRLLDGIEDANGVAMANRTLAIIRRVMNWHAARTDDFRSPIVRGMSRGKEVPRDRILTDDELRAVWRATGEVNLPQMFSAYVRFLLLTGARRKEAAALRRVELVGNEWTLPASRNKTGQELIRPLSRAALQIVEGLPKLGEWVFTHTGNAALSNLGRFKVELDRASGTSAWTYHDLRRTARSLMSRAGVPSDHAERCLGHVIGGVRGVYDRHTYREEMLIAYEKLAALIAQIVDPQENVVAIRGQR
jgi:integrase